MRRGESSRILLQTLLTESTPEELELEKSEPKSFRYGRRRLINTDFYILDVHTGDVETLPRIVQDRDSEMCSMAVALRSRVYVSGGQIRGDTDQPQSPRKTTSKLFYFLDLEDKDNYGGGGGWKRAGPPLTAKHQLHLDAGVPFAGNMYFFRDSPFSCLCELFDPISYQWRRIKSLPGADDQGRRLHISPPVLADDKNERIIVRINDSMYAYYPSRDEWEFVVKGFKGWYSQLHPVTIVDGVIYIHHHKIPGFFRAFDIATKQYLSVQLSSIHNYDESSLLHLYSYGNLVHLGDGILCLLGQTYQDHEPGQSQTTALHVVQFKVELIKNNNNDAKEVLVTPTSSKYHHLTSRCHLVNCLLI